MRPPLRKRKLRLTGGADAARASLTKPRRETEALDLQGQKKADGSCVSKSRGKCYAAVLF